MRSSAKHRLRPHVKGVDLGQRGTETLRRLRDSFTFGRIGRWVECQIMRSACCEKRSFIREMAVDRKPLHACLFGYRADRGVGATDRLVKMNCRLDNSFAGLPLAVCS